MMKKRIAIIVIVSFFMDQTIKLLVTKYLTSIKLIPGFLSFIYTKNKGVAFSMLWGNRWLIITISILLVIFLLFTLNNNYLKYKKNSNITNWTFGLLIGGIFGNLFDRITRGYVVDYLSFNLFGYSFPIFNLADVFITIGVILMATYWLNEDTKK